MNMEYLSIYLVLLSSFIRSCIYFIRFIPECFMFWCSWMLLCCLVLNSNFTAGDTTVFYFQLTWLEVHQFYWSFPRTSFWFYWISLLIGFNLIDFFSNFIIQYSSAYFMFNCHSFSSFLKWKLRLLILDLSYFLHMYSML